MIVQLLCSTYLLENYIKFYTAKTRFAAPLPFFALYITLHKKYIAVQSLP